MHEHIAALDNSIIWTIGGTTRWDPLRDDPTSVANRLIQGEWYSRDADVYRAAAERYLLWLLHALDIARLPRTPNRILEHLEPTQLLALLRTFNNHKYANTLTANVQGLGKFEREAIAGFRARFGVVLEGIAGPSLGQGLAIENAIQANQAVLFSLDAASYPTLATKIGAWILLDLVRIAAQRPGPCLVIVDEFSALGREGRHVIPLLARTREAGMACVVATQGIADLARVDPNLPQQITQNTAVRLALRQGSAEDQEGWSILLGGAPVPYTDSKHYVHGSRARAVSPDDLATLRTGEAFLQVMPGATDGMRKRLWIAQPQRRRGVGETYIPEHTPEPDQPASTRSAGPGLPTLNGGMTMMNKQPNQRHLPQWRITERDLAIVGEVLRWQQLTTRQIARWFFDSPRTATNRIAVLQTLGYVKTIDIPWRAPVLVTATPKAARARADLRLQPAAASPVDCCTTRPWSK